MYTHVSHGYAAHLGRTYVDVIERTCTNVVCDAAPGIRHQQWSCQEMAAGAQEQIVACQNAFSLVFFALGVVLSIRALAHLLEDPAQLDAIT